MSPRDNAVSITDKHGTLKAQIECCLSDGEIGSVLVDAYRTTDPGLVVHKDYGHNNPTTWAVTHRPSGYRVLGYFKTRRAALAFAEQAAPLTDWTEDKETLLAAKPAFIDRLRALTEAANARRERVPA